MPIVQAPSIESIRSLFPALSPNFAFLENAGGSQLPKSVIDAMSTYMLDSFVQLGAPYSMSERATETVARAHECANRFVNGDGVGSTIIGPSTTQLCHMLAECYAERLKPGDEIVIAESAHEANAGPWQALARKGAVIKWWKVNPETYECPIEDLENLLSERTRIVALPHVSNLLGHIVDLEAVTQLAHSFNARVVADGVAYAPHRAIDVKAWDVDFYVFSWYKVYGPHAASMFGKAEAWAELTGPNHFFIPDDQPYKFELGGPSHEACAGILAVEQYLLGLGEGLTGAFERITDLEVPVQTALVDFLLDQRNVRIIGPQASGTGRVPTISFVHSFLGADVVAEKVCGERIGIRNGHMYAYRMCQALGLDLDTGVVRVSAVHYNTEEEIRRLIRVLAEIL